MLERCMHSACTAPKMGPPASRLIPPSPRQRARSEAWPQPTRHEPDTQQCRSLVTRAFEFHSSHVKGVPGCSIPTLQWLWGPRGPRPSSPGDGHSHTKYWANKGPPTVYMSLEHDGRDPFSRARLPKCRPECPSLRLRVGPARLASRRPLRPMLLSSPDGHPEPAPRRRGVRAAVLQAYRSSASASLTRGL